jgi:hypothetical protein
MLRVACVLKSGGEYDHQHVEWLRRSVRRYLTLPHRFICLTDMDVGCEKIPLENDWPGWWSKIHLMKLPVADGPIIYFDLDTLIIGSLDDVVLGHRFSLLRTFWPSGFVNSSVMAWSIDVSSIYDAFATKPERYMNEYRVVGKWGDQDFIARHLPVEREYLQVKNPGKFASYKRTLRGNPPLPDVSVIVFHGKPKPWDTELGQREYATYQ